MNFGDTSNTNHKCPEVSDSEIYLSIHHISTWAGYSPLAPPDPLSDHLHLALCLGARSLQTAYPRLPRLFTSIGLH